jgi:hypothetical protein
MYLVREISLLPLFAFLAPHVGSFRSGWPPPGLGRLTAIVAWACKQAGRLPPPPRMILPEEAWMRIVEGAPPEPAASGRAGAA